MKILALNCGSSSLKFQLVKIHNQKRFPFREEKIAIGIVDRIGRQKETLFKAFCGSHIRKSVPASDHSVAAKLILEWLRSQGFLKSDGIQAVGHRVVHGGDRFFQPTMITDDVIRGIEEIGYLAPLHNQLSLDAIRAARALLGSSIPQFVVFDTAFHHTIPDFASIVSKNESPAPQASPESPRPKENGLSLRRTLSCSGSGDPDFSPWHSDR